MEGMQTVFSSSSLLSSFNPILEYTFCYKGALVRTEKRLQSMQSTDSAYSAPGFNSSPDGLTG